MMPDRRIQGLFGIDLPIVQALMTRPTTIDWGGRKQRRRNRLG
jgi:hypothetical protein